MREYYMITQDGSKYYITKRKNLAEALTFLGFKYYKFQDDTMGGETRYSFIKNEALLLAIRKLEAHRVEVKNKLYGDSIPDLKEER